MEKFKMVKIPFYKAEQVKKMAYKLQAVVNSEIGDEYYDRLCYCMDELNTIITDIVNYPNEVNIKPLQK